MSQHAVSPDLEHDRRDPLLDHRLLKQIRQTTFLFGVQVVLMKIVDVEIALAGRRVTPPQATLACVWRACQPHTSALVI